MFAKFFALFSTILLSFPAFYAARFGALLYRISNLTAQSEAELLLIRTTEERLQKLRDGWSPLHSGCLLGGTLLALLANGLDLYEVWVGG